MLSTTDEMLVKAQEKGVLFLLRLVQALLRYGYGTRDLGVTIVTIKSQFIQPEEDIDPTHASIHGFAGSLAKEYPHWKLRVADLEDAHTSVTLRELLQLPPDADGNAWAFRGGEWFRAQLNYVERAAAPIEAFRRGGVFVIIGGAGGLGGGLLRIPDSRIRCTGCVDR